MKDNETQKLEVIFGAVFVVLFTLVYSLAEFAKTHEVSAFYPMFIAIPIMAAFALQSRNKLTPMKWWHVVLALLGIFVGPFLIMYLVVALMGRL